MTIKPNQLEIEFLQSDKDKLDGIEAGAEVNPAIASKAVAEAGLDNAQYMTSLRVAQAIAAQVGSTAGEANTVSNEGSGEGLFIQKAGVNLEFKSLIAGTGITFSTGANDITINASTGGLTDTDDLPEGSTNLYYTDVRVSANSDVVANTAKISADGSINTHSDVNITSPSNGEVLVYQSGNWVNQAGGAGEANTASNLGAGEGIFAQKSSVDLEFKSLVAGTNVTLSSSGTEITINSSGSGASALDDLSDVNTTGATAGQFLSYNGSTWVPATSSGSSSAGQEETFNLAAGADIATRVTGATNVPAGWSLAPASTAGQAQLGSLAETLVISHNEGKLVQEITVFEETTSGPTSLQGVQKINLQNTGDQKNTTNLNHAAVIDLQTKTSSSKSLVVFVKFVP